MLHSQAWAYGGHVGLHEVVSSEVYSVCCQGQQLGENHTNLI